MSTHDTHTPTEHELAMNEIELDRDKKNHLITFAFSIVFTALAFIAVAFEMIPRTFTLPFIFGLGIVQAVFQGLIWMHLNQRGHRFANIFMLGAVFVTILTLLTFVFIVSWY